MDEHGSAHRRDGPASDFVKYEALGNDYIVIDPQRSSIDVTLEGAARLCDRRRGIGADGVLWGPFVDDGAISVRLFNADGSRCEGSGNGLRIFAHYVRSRGYVADRIVALKAAGRTCRVEILDLAAGILKIGLGRPSLKSSALPASGPEREIVDDPLEVDGEVFAVTCLTNGSPHCVVFDDRLSGERMERFGPAIGRGPLFPKGVNVEMAKVVDRRHLRAECWERGSGHVPASGSGACAVAYAAHMLGRVGSDVAVEMPGGPVSVSISTCGEVFLSGEVREVATGTCAPLFHHHIMDLTRRDRRRA